MWVKRLVLAVKVQPSEAVGRSRTQDVPASDPSMRRPAAQAVAVVLCRLDTAVPAGRWPVGCSSRMAVVPRLCSYGPCLASKDGPVSCCWEVARIHCRRHSEPVEGDPEEVCCWHLAEPHPCPDTLAAARKVFDLVALLVSTAFGWAVAVAAADLE